jgi:hypothetical protein
LGGATARIGPDAELRLPDRLHVLVDAGIALSSELSLDALLQRIVETAATLTGARYAALGVIDSSGTALERFLTVGVDEETRAGIGDPPLGRGILGVLIRDAQPLRLENIADDPRSVGFPPGHPPMRSFLGVPILLRGVAYGNLYLTEKDGGAGFTEDDAELTQLLAARSSTRSAPSRRASGTFTPPSARGCSQPSRRSAVAPPRTRCPSASTRSCGSSRSATRTRRSRSCSTSPSGPRRRAGPTSCESSTSRAGPSSCGTRWRKVCWSSDRR